MKSAKKRSRGRPVEKRWPDQIPDTPENVAKALVRARHKRRSEWKYLKEAKSGGGE